MVNESISREIRGQENKSLVDLVTPFYNALPWFPAYLESVLAQTWRPLRFIAVDDGSTDGSLAYLRQKVPAFEAAGIDLCILAIDHGGQAAAVNAALPFLSGNFFAWCDADDILTPDSVEKKALYLMKHPQLGMVRSDGHIVLEETGKAKRIARAADYWIKDIFDDLFHQMTYCCAGCYMLRTKLFFDCYPEKQIPISPEGQNLQLLLPPASRTACGFIPEQLFYYYVRSSGHSSRRRSYTEQLSRIENFARLRAQILPYCDCDREYYLAENERMRQEQRRRLLYSALQRIREEKSDENRNYDPA